MQDFEDSPPLEKPDTIPPAALPTLTGDTEPAPAEEDPVLGAVRAVHRLVADLALKVDSFEHKIDHAVDQSRAACSAAVMGADEMKQIRRDLTLEHVQVMGALDEIRRTFGQAIISVSTTVHDQAVVLHEHQRRIDGFESTEEELHAANGNGHG